MTKSKADDPLLVGQKFGRLTIIKIGITRLENKDKSGKTMKRKMLLCMCDCGIQKEIRAGHVLSGRTVSCGCIREITNPNKASLATAKRVYKSKYADGDLTFDDFLVLSQYNCYYCDTPPSNTTNKFFYSESGNSEFTRLHGYFTYNGLDRIDSTKSHTKNNVVPCCKWCNYAKRERTVDEFREWIVRLTKFLAKSS